MDARQEREIGSWRQYVRWWIERSREQGRLARISISLMAALLVSRVVSRRFGMSRFASPAARGSVPMVVEAVLRDAAKVATMVRGVAAEVVADWPVARLERLRPRLIGGLVACETTLLLISLVPQSVWASLKMPNGPIPSLLTPLLALLFYLIPTLVGALCRAWPAALALATLPAWLDLGVFAIAAAPRLGFAYLAQDPHASGAIGTLELFGGLGFFGWIARRAALDLIARRRATR